MIHQIANVSHANEQLGQLSQKYESAKMGSLSIGYDRTGGTSYGTYQLSSRTGHLIDFLNIWKIKNHNGLKN